MSQFTGIPAEPPLDYRSPLSLKDLQHIFLELFDDVHDAKEYLRGLQRQRRGQSLQWHLAAGIHLMLLRRRYDPNKRKSLLAQQIIADKAVTLFDKQPQTLDDEDKTDEQLIIGSSPNSSDVTHHLTTISYHLDYFGENVSKIDQALDFLGDLQEELNDEILNQCLSTTEINDYVTASISRLKALKKDLSDDIKRTKKQISLLVELMSN